MIKLLVRQRHFRRGWKASAIHAYTPEGALSARKREALPRLSRPDGMGGQLDFQRLS
jgi:hypothetical protein